MLSSKYYDHLVIKKPGLEDSPAIQFAGNYDAAFAFLRNCPPFSLLSQDMHTALAEDVKTSTKYSRRDMLAALARRLADGRLVVAGRFSHQEQGHNFKRLPKQPAKSVAATPTQKPKPTPKAAAPKQPKNEIDQTAQVQALKDASEQGTPFCEVCEKLKQEQAQQQAS